LSKELSYQFETYCKSYELRSPLIKFFLGVIAIIALSLLLMVTAPIFGSDPLPLIIFLIIFGVPSYYAILDALLRDVIRISICPEDVVITRGLIQRKTIYIPIARIAHVGVKNRYVLVFRSLLAMTQIIVVYRDQNDMLRSIKFFINNARELYEIVKALTDRGVTVHW
jgi:uncharacterized membrane protein YdbT with pleckstrin-like domain